MVGFSDTDHACTVHIFYWKIAGLELGHTDRRYQEQESNVTVALGEICADMNVTLLV